MERIDHFEEFASKMQEAGIQRPAIHAFENSYRKLLKGESGLVSEKEIEPVTTLPGLDEIGAQEDKSLLRHTVVIKLNGGLGTGMGLEGPKSLLPVRNGLTFLDFIARQILFLRQSCQQPLRFVLMNSFSTSEPTLAYLSRYKELGDRRELELLQGQVPKIDAATLRPVRWPENPQLEWCPPGHGDIYPSLVVSGLLEKLLSSGVKYAFVSNADNLGASLDLRLLNYFAQSNQSFIMEVTERTEADKKGGHLARSKRGNFLLRESAQCPEEEMSQFQDIRRHRFFNTNNLWIRLDHLDELLTKNHGIIPLPLIKNSKTVDPRDKNSPQVYQLETAMGAAIEAFENAGAVDVPRSRFAPVKTTSDLFTLRSDACEVTDDWRVILSPELAGRPPAVQLDGEYYKLVDQLDRLAPVVPSLKNCKSLKVQGPVSFGAGLTFRGDVSISNPKPAPQPLKPGIYENQEITLG